MANPGLAPEVLQETLDLVEKHGSVALAARATGTPYNTMHNRYRQAKVWGSMSEGEKESMEAARLQPGVAKGGWIITDKEGEIIRRSTRWTAPEIEDDTLERIKAAMEGIEPALPKPVPPNVEEDLMTVYPIADAHIGMMAWGRETGERYSTDIAVNRLQEWLGRCVASSPASKRAVILDVGDLTHADDQNNQTPRSKHILDVDNRHFRTLETTIGAIGHCTELALSKHEHVTVIILPGNHNPHSYMAILFAIAERYRDEPRVTVRKEPGEFWVEEFGVNMLAAHHGDKAPPERLVLFLADQHKEAWGRTHHRVLWTGHRHHHASKDIGGVTWEQLRALTAKDAYAVANAYSARAQLQAITLHKERGEVMRVKVND